MESDPRAPKPAPEAVDARSALGLPEPIDPGAAPLLPRHLVDLFFHPGRFFSGQLALGRTPYAVFVAWCYGAATAIDRIDQDLLRAELGRPRPGWEALAPWVADSWLGFWAFVLVTGAASGAVLWWLGGWWFSLRLSWSGAAAPDRRLARLVMAYSAFVHAGPTVLAAGVSTFLYASYARAFSSEELWSAVLLVFPFWSVAASYQGARRVFGLSGWRVRLWFLVLPLLCYVVALGVVGALVVVFAPDASGG